jgi:predicted O-methyltransferase YrrM
MTSTTHAVGAELELFAAATNWKRYWMSRAIRFITGDVAEVGAGIGTNTGLLCGAAGVRRWVCLEPDAALVRRLRETFERTGLDRRVQVIAGTVDDLSAAERFDSILYIDVLEHIRDDKAELMRSARRLRPGGALVVLAPAHQSLFSAFDAAIGHHRRYTRRSLARVVPSTLSREQLVYLDSIGLIASAANRLLLRRAIPTARQIRVWDSVLVRGSRMFDPLFRYAVGKSVLGVWRLPGGPV